MQLLVNGKPHEIGEADVLDSVIARLVPDCGRVIAELNGKIVKRGDWPRTALGEGDRLELVTFVGGG